MNSIFENDVVVQNFNISFRINQEKQNSFFWIRVHFRFDEHIWKWFDVEYDSIHFKHETKFIEFIIEHFIKFRNFRTIDFSIQSHDICKTYQNRYKRNRFQSDRKKRVLKQTKNHKRKKNRFFLFCDVTFVLIHTKIENNSILHRISTLSFKFWCIVSSNFTIVQIRSRVSILKNKFI